MPPSLVASVCLVKYQSNHSDFKSWCRTCWFYQDGPDESVNSSERLYPGSVYSETWRMSPFVFWMNLTLKGIFVYKWNGLCVGATLLLRNTGNQVSTHSWSSLYSDHIINNNNQPGLSYSDEIHFTQFCNMTLYLDNSWVNILHPLMFPFTLVVLWMKPYWGQPSKGVVLCGFWHG